MRRESTCRRTSTQAGFTLIEALIAMVVLVLLTAVLLRGTVAVRADAGWFADHTMSTLVATSLLDGAVADRHLRNGTTHGERNGLSYTLVASPAGIEAQLPAARPDPAAAPRPNPNGVPAPAATPAAPRWRPQRIVVRVEAPGRPVTLETIRLAAVP